MKKLIYIILMFSFFGHSQDVLRVSSSGRVLNGRVFSFGAEAPTTPSASITATDGTATEESTTTGTFTITLSSASVGTTTVNYTVSGTATSGSDYTSIGTSVNILDGQTTATITVTPIDDATEESTETVIVTLASGSGYTVGSPSNATINITDNDGAIASCTPGTPTSVTTLAGLTGATPGSTVEINGSINATGSTFAANLIITAGSGSISGTGINLNGACIHDEGSQIFASSVTFNSLYEGSRLSPEVFGGIANDATADDTALSALINNCRYATATLNGVYIKNAESTYSRSGEFDWDMNGAIIRVTSAASLSHGSATSNEDKWLIRWQLDSVVLKNGEFDGNDLASRWMKFDDQQSFTLDSLKIYDVLSPAGAYARGVALKFNIYGTNFTGGSITNLDIDNIGATSDGIANNTPYGVSKAFYFEVFDNGVTPATITMSGNNVNNVYGDDAEGFYNAPGFGGSYNYTTNNVAWDIDNDVYIDCERRALKLNASNVNCNNISITSSPTAPAFAGAQATLFHVFSIRSAAPIDDIVLTNSTITRTGSAQNILFGVTDAKDVLIDNNTWNAQSALDLYGFCSFGNDIDQSGLYSGDLDNVDFTNNTLNNVGIQLYPNFLVPTGGGLTIDSNTMDFDISSFAGGHSGMILIYDLNGGSASVPVTISNLSITANLQLAGSSLFGGVIKARQNSVEDLTLSNVDVTWTGSAPFYNYGHFLSNFGSTNTIINCDITGRSGTNAITVDGATQNPVITNSFGDGATPITVQ